MALEKYSVEIKDNATQASQNIEKLTAAIERLTRAMVRGPESLDSSQKRVADDMKKGFGAQMAAMPDKIIDVIATMAKWGARIIAVGSSLVFLNNMLEKGGGGMSIWFNKLRKNNKLVGSLSDSLGIAGNKAAQYSQVIRGASHGMAGVAKVMADAATGKKGIRESIKSIQIMVSGYSTALAAFDRQSMDTAAGQKRIQLAIAQTAKIVDDHGVVTRKGLEPEAFQRHFNITRKQYDALSDKVQETGKKYAHMGDEVVRANMVTQELTAAQHKQKKAITTLSHWMGRHSTQYQGMNLVMALVIRSTGKFVSKVGKAMVNRLIELAVKASQYEISLRNLSIATKQFNDHTKGGKLAQGELATWVNKTSIELGIQAKDLAQVTALMFDYASMAGLGAKEVKEMVVRSADLAAVMHTSLDEAFQTVISGVSTSSINLRKLNIRLKESELASEGYLDKSKVVAGTVTEEELAIARLNAMLGQSAQYAGTAAAKADSFAGSLDRLAVASENMQRNIGEGAELAIRPFLSLLTNVQTTIAGLPMDVQRAIGSFQALAAVFLTVSGGAMVLIGTLATLATAVKLLNIFMADFSGVLAGTIAKFAMVDKSVVLSLATGKSFGALLQVLIGSFKRVMMVAKTFAKSVLVGMIARLKQATMQMHLFTAANWAAVKATKAIILRLAAFYAIYKTAETTLNQFGDAMQRISEDMKDQKEAVTNDVIPAYFNLITVLKIGAEVIGLVLTQAILGLLWAINGLVAGFGLLSDTLGLTTGLYDESVARIKAIENEFSKFGDRILELTDKYELLGKKKEKHVAEIKKEIDILKGLQKIQLLHKLGLLDIIEAQKELKKVEEDVRKIKGAEKYRRAWESSINFYEKEVALVKEQLVLAMKQARVESASVVDKQGQLKIQKELTVAKGAWYELVKKSVEQETFLLEHGDAKKGQESAKILALKQEIEAEKEAITVRKASIAALMEKRALLQGKGETGVIDKASKAFTNMFDIFKLDKVIGEEQRQLWIRERNMKTHSTFMHNYLVELTQEYKSLGLAGATVTQEMVRGAQAEVNRLKALSFEEGSPEEKANLEVVKQLEMKYESLKEHLASITKIRRDAGDLTQKDIGTLEKEAAIKELLAQVDNFALGQEKRLEEFRRSKLTDQERLVLLEGDYAKSKQKVIEAFKEYAGVQLDENVTTKETLKQLRELDHVVQNEIFPSIQHMTDAWLVYQQLQEQLTNEMPSLIDMIKLVGNVIADAFQESIVSAFDAIMEGTFDVEQAFASMVDSILASMARMAADELTDQLVKLAAAALKAMTATQGQDWSKVSKGDQQAAQNLAMSVASSLIGFQHGGVVTQPTAALIGEAGPEAVIPLDKLGDFNQQQPFIIVNLTGRPEDVVQTGITSNPDVVINPILQDARFGGRMRQAFR